MDAIYVNAENVAEGVYETFKSIDLLGKYVPGSGANSFEGEMMKEVFLSLEIENPFDGYCVPKCIITDLDGLVDYEFEFVNGTRDDMADKLGYTYHKLFADDYPKMIETLKEYKYTRQAILPVGAGSFYKVKDDKPCLTEIMFKVRSDNRLWVTAVFRSNDAVRAFPMNIWAIARLLKCVSEEVDIPAGGMNYIANSFHIYPGCENTLKGCITRYDNSMPNEWAWTEEEYMERREEIKRGME